MKQPNLLQKLNQIFDKKQKRQLVLLGFMIFIGGFLETLGVSTMIPVVTVLLTPEKVQEYIDKYEVLGNICTAFHITNVNQVAVSLLLFLMAVYVIKNLYLLFLVYRQNTFITQNRNNMIKIGRAHV